MGKRCDPLFSHVKANHGGERDPVCVFAIDIAAVNQINVEVVDRTPAQPDLEARLGYAKASCRAPSWPKTSAVSVQTLSGVRQSTPAP